jgi:predicted RNA-binding protein
VTNEENWKVIKERKVWGVPERDRRQIGRVEPGDFLVFYVMPRRIAGIFKAASEPFRSSERVFSSRSGKEVFPHRVKLEPVVIAKEPLPFRELIPKLKFITNKKTWSGHLRRAMRIIPREDYDLIFRAVSRADGA